MRQRPDKVSLNKHEETTVMDRMMDDVGWMMGGMTVIWILVLVALVLGVAALIKYLRT